MEFRGAPFAGKKLDKPYADLLADLPAVRSFFPDSPYQQDSFERRRAHLAGQGARSVTTARLLAAYQESLAAAPPAVLAARRLGEPETLAVVAEGRPGLLTGTLATIYKAVTAVKLARWAEDCLQCPVVPIFWMLSDDHQLAAATHTVVVDRRGRLGRVDLELNCRPGEPLGRVRLDRGAALRAAGTLEALAEHGPHGPAVRAFLTGSSLTGARTVADWFARLLAGLFSRHGLVVVDPLAAGMALVARPVLQQALVRRESLLRELKAAAGRLQRRGYRPLLAPSPGYTGLFYVHRGIRRGLLWQDGSVSDRYGEVRFSVTDLARRLENRPEEFGPGAVLRPLIHAAMFKVVARVAGPTECALLAQMRDVFPLFSRELPVVHPRLSLTLVETREQDLWQHYGLTFDAVIDGLDQHLREELARRDHLALPALFQAQREAVHSSFVPLEPALSRLEPSLSALGRRIAGRMVAQVDYLEKKAVRWHRREQQGVVEHFRQLNNRLCPGGSLQEDVLNPFPFLIRNGFGLVDRLLGAPLDRRHQLAFFKAPDARRSQIRG